MPEVSVVLPVFNAASTIERAIYSILEQTLRDIELIVVNDGSTDETASLVQEINDPRIRLIHQSHQHVAIAANLGTSHATAPLVARMDADDFAYPERLELQREILLREKLDVVGSQVRIVNDTGQAVLTMANYQHWINEETLTSEKICSLRFVEFPLVNPTILARRAYFELGCRDGDFPEDYDLMLRATAKGLHFGKVAQVLLDWTDGPDRLTRTDGRYMPAAFDRCRRTHLLGGPLDGVQEVDLWGMGQTGKPWIRWLQENDIHVRHGYDVSPRKQGVAIHGVSVTTPDELAPADGTPLLIAVGAKGARQVITPQLLNRDYTIGGDAWFVS